MAQLIATAFPEWLAMARPGRIGAFVLQQGRGAVLPETDPLSTCEALAVAQLDLKDRDARIRIAVPLAAPRFRPWPRRLASGKNR